MSIERTNILSLIGGNGRYHSCILTTYSFDFYFFELKLMRWLRSCGVNNTTVFIDGHFYSDLMQNPTGEEMSNSSNYSLIPIFGKKIFHPKMLMLFGEEEGLLIVGSGNLTNAGNGSNDEIWGAYHFDIRNPKSKTLFSSAWNYLKQLSLTVKGVNHERITSWITDNSKWLKELPAVEDFQFNVISENESVAFLYNSSESTIWESLLRLTGNDDVREIIIVSPYYDLSGKALIEIKKEFPAANINVVLDENGVLPHKLLNVNDFTFFDWKEINISRDIGVQQKSRLHAKILYLKTSNGIEYCLFGSSNITSAGLGISKTPNNEVSLFVKSTKNDLLKRIGIKITSNSSIPLSSFRESQKVDIVNHIFSKNSYSVKLYSAEAYEYKLTIYSDVEKETPVLVVLYDKNNHLYRKETIKNFTKRTTISLNSNDERLHYIQIQGIEGDNISNKVLISRIENIIRTHPNRKNAQFEKVLSQFHNGEFSKLFDLIYYASIYVTEKRHKDPPIAGIGEKNTQTEKYSADQSRLYDLSEYREVDSNSFLRESSILQSPTLQILDAIKFSKTHKLEFQSELREDEQMNDIGAMDGDEKFSAIQEELIPLRVLKARKRKIKNYFSNLYRYLHTGILYSDHELSKHKLSLTDFSKYLVALELINIFGGKTKFVEKEQSCFHYLPLSGDYKLDNVKGFCLRIIGDFLRIARNGFISYDFDYTNKKFKELQSDALVNTLVCILNVSWGNNEKHYFKTLLLNTLHFLGWDNVADFDRNIEELFPKLKERANTLGYKSKNFDNQLDFFVKSVCPAFRKANHNRENKRFDNYAYENQIIYLSSFGIGYSCVLSAYNKNEYTLMRAGFKWDEKTRQFSNLIRDESHERLKITKMTIVDL